MPAYRFDADELLKEELILSKLEVGVRQLNTAIRMFFSDDDVVSTHTVACAAHGVLRDLALHKGFKKSVKDSPLIANDARAEYLKAVNFPQNFFKHADQDPRGRMAFRYNGVPLFILDAVVLAWALDVPLSHEMKIFLMWVQLRFPDLLCFEHIEQDLAQIRNTTHNPSAFKALGRLLLREGEKSVT